MVVGSVGMVTFCAGSDGLLILLRPGVWAHTHRVYVILYDILRPQRAFGMGTWGPKYLNIGYTLWDTQPFASSLEEPTA